MVSWEGGATGMHLQRTLSLVNQNWQTVAGSQLTNQMYFSTSPNAAFFRISP
jgi:hypothetical protein